MSRECEWVLVQPSSAAVESTASIKVSEQGLWIKRGVGDDEIAPKELRAGLRMR